MIQLKDLTVKNFMSVGNSTQAINFESVDQIVTEQIINIDSEFYDNKLLLEIYRSL